MLVLCSTLYVLKFLSVPVMGIVLLCYFIGVGMEGHIGAGPVEQRRKNKEIAFNYIVVCALFHTRMYLKSATNSRTCDCDLQNTCFYH